MSNTAGAALWTLDYTLFAAQLGITRVHFHEGIGYKYNLVHDFVPSLKHTPNSSTDTTRYPDPFNHRRLCPSYPSSTPRPTSILRRAHRHGGRRDLRRLSSGRAANQRRASIGLCGVRGWETATRGVDQLGGVLEERGGSAKRESCEGRVWGQRDEAGEREGAEAGDRVRVHVNIIFWLEEELITDYICSSHADDASGLTWAGQSFETPDARPQGTLVEETAQLSNGILVSATEAVLLTFT